jgi:hypothetical protein
MAKDIHESMRNKVREFFASAFPGMHFSVAPDALVAAIDDVYPGPNCAHDIAFHLTDWMEDAAFLIALNLKPEIFTKTEIAEGVRGCLVHIPNHVAAAATLGGWPMHDVFKVGATILPKDQD